MPAKGFVNTALTESGFQSENWNERRRGILFSPTEQFFDLG